MKSDPNDKMDYSFNYETGVGMKGGWGFSKIEDIQKDFTLDCQGLNYIDGKQFLFLVKVTNSYKLVYNTSKKLIPVNNYLYSYDTISKNIKYVDTYIKTCDTKFSEDMETKTKAIVNETAAEEAKEDDNLTNAELNVDQIIDKVENLEEGTKEKAELLSDLSTKLKEEAKIKAKVEQLEEELEDIQGVRIKAKKEPKSKLIYTKLQETDISTINDINQLKKIKSRIQGNITKASNEMDRISEDVRSQLGSNTKQVRDELKKHRLYNENVLKKEANEAKIAEIDDRILELEGEQQIKKGGYKPFGDSYKQVGGAGESARDRYYLTQGIQGLNTENYYGQQQQPYLQQPYGQQLYGQQPYGQQPMSYGQQQPLYPSLNPFQRQQPIPYGQQLINPLDQITYAKQMSYYNKALELESKLAFYVNVELTLFPGTSVNPLQKASALCSARFEDIRKAFTEILGLEYRPRPLTDNSYYNKELEKQTKEIKRGGSIKNRKLKKNNTIRIKYKN